MSTTAEKRAKWTSCWNDTVSGIIVGEIEDAKFGLLLIADLEAAVRERDEAVALLRELHDGVLDVHDGDWRPMEAAKSFLDTRRQTVRQNTVAVEVRVSVGEE